MITKTVSTLASFISLALLFVFCDRTALFAILCATALHELGHIAAAKILRIKISCFSVDLLGARLDTEHSSMSYSDEIILSASGAFINILTVLFFRGCSLPFLVHLRTSSFGLAFLNLLPVESFDGGHILYCSLAKFTNVSTVTKILRVFSFLCIFMLWCVSVYFLIRFSDSLSLFVFSTSLFNRLFCQNNEIYGEKASIKKK